MIDMTILISTIGAILTVGITINGFFLKGIWNSQTDMQIKLAEVMVKIENYNSRIETLEHNLRKLELGHMECRGKCENTNITV